MAVAASKQESRRMSYELLATFRGAIFADLRGSA